MRTVPTGLALERLDLSASWSVRFSSYDNIVKSVGMLLVAALSSAVTFVIALSLLFFNLQNEMLLLTEEVKQEDTSSTSLIPYYKLTDMFSGSHIGHIGNSIAIIRSSIETSEYIRSLTFFATYSLEVISDTAIYLLDNTDVQSYTGENARKRWMFGMIVSYCVLFILVNKRKVLLRGYVNRATPAKTSVEPTFSLVEAPNPVTEAEGRNRVECSPPAACVSARIPKLVKKSKHRNSTVRMMYERAFCILEEACFLSKNHSSLSKHTMLEYPMLNDILDMMEPLQKYIHEGVENLNLLSQEYIKQNAELVEAEEKIKNVDKYRDVIQNEAEVLMLLSDKDTEIGRLNLMVDQLKSDVNHFFNDSMRLTSELNTLASQIEKQSFTNNDILQIQKDSLKEAHGVRQFVEDELQVEIELNKTIKEEYARNVQCLVKMLLTASDVGAIPFDSVENFLVSDMFTDFLKVEDFPTELSASALFKDLPHLATTYSAHLKMQNNLI